MTAWERVFHALLFECFAIIFTVILTSWLTSHRMLDLTAVIVMISVIAMVWNVIFNWGFDKVFTGERVQRGLGIRILHSFLFEGGLLVFYYPTGDVYAEYWLVAGVCDGYWNDFICVGLFGDF